MAEELVTQIKITYPTKGYRLVGDDDSPSHPHYYGDDFSPINSNPNRTPGPGSARLGDGHPDDTTDTGRLEPLTPYPGTPGMRPYRRGQGPRIAR